MPGVQGIGTVDYNNPYQQYQNVNDAQQVPVEEPQQMPVDEAQMPVDAQQMPVDLSGQIPADYSTEVEGQNKSSGSMTGLAVLGGLALAGLCLWGGRKMGKNAAKDIEKELNELKNSEAVQNYDKMKEAVNEIIERAETTENFKLLKPKTWKNAKFVKFIKEKLSPFKNEAEKTADETKNAAEEVKNAADDAAEKAA